MGRWRAPTLPSAPTWLITPTDTSAERPVSLSGELAPMARDSPSQRTTSPSRLRLSKPPKRLLPRRRARNEEPFSLKFFREMCDGPLLHSLLLLFVKDDHPFSQ